MNHHHHHDSSRNIGWAFGLNLLFTVVEFIGGILTNSTAIMADAVHDLGDSISLGLAWILQSFSNKAPNDRYTYGYKRLSLVGAFINAVILIGGSVWVLQEAIPRLWDPTMPIADGMFVIAVFGVIVNGYAAYRLSSGKTLNERVLNWHLLEDVFGWVAVLIIATVLMFVDLPILDPLLSIGFTAFILLNVSRNLWQTIKIFIQATPDESIYREISDKLGKLNNVESVHHLHIWSLDAESNVLTCHLTLSSQLNTEERHRLKCAIGDLLEPFSLSHTTIELEYPDERCRDSQI